MSLPTDPNQRLVQIATNGIDFDSRTIYINGEVSQERNLVMIPALRIMDESDGQVSVIINSGGGDSDMGIALYDMLRAMRNEVVTVNVSRAFSIAALILQAGDLRLALPHAEVMIHNGFLEIQAGPGSAIDNDGLAEMVAESKRSDEVYHTILQKHTKQNIKKISRWCETDTYFDAKDSLKYGFIDAIIDEKYTKPMKVKAP